MAAVRAGMFSIASRERGGKGKPAPPAFGIPSLRLEGGMPAVSRWVVRGASHPALLCPRRRVTGHLYRLDLPALLRLGFSLHTGWLAS